eukprot:scaffold13731_cov51-Attheya_sp.AAC.5
MDGFRQCTLGLNIEHFFRTRFSKKPVRCHKLTPIEEGQFEIEEIILSDIECNRFVSSLDYTATAQFRDCPFSSFIVSRYPLDR